MRTRGKYAGLPTITTTNWFRVRERFKEKIPPIVTSERLLPHLALKDAHSINCNVIVPLKQMGILDDLGAPTDLARRWRIDSEYSDVCKIILERVYPREVIDLLREGGCSKADIQDCFFRNGFGKESSRKMARVLLMLDGGEFTRVSHLNKGERMAKKEAKADATRHIDSARASRLIAREGGGETGPSIHIDLQIHISPDSPPEQIEAIFSSMARHLYGN